MLSTVSDQQQSVLNRFAKLRKTYTKRIDTVKAEVDQQKQQIRDKRKSQMLMSNSGNSLAKIIKKPIKPLRFTKNADSSNVKQLLNNNSNSQLNTVIEEYSAAQPKQPSISSAIKTDFTKPNQSYGDSAGQVKPKYKFAAKKKAD